MTGNDWLAWCDATAEDEAPLGFREEDEEDEEEEPEPGERVWGTAGFAKGGALDALPGPAHWRSWLMRRPDPTAGTRAPRTMNCTG